MRQPREDQRARKFQTDPRTRSGRVATLFGLLAFLGAIGLSTPGVEAQTRLIPQIGMYSSVGDPSSIRGVSGAYEIGRHDSSRALGLVAQFGGRSGLGFRVGGLFVNDIGGPLQPSGCDACAAEADLISGYGALLIRPFGNLFFMAPYIVAGAGAQRFQTDGEGIWDQVARLGDDRSDWIGVLGVGSELDFGGAQILIELTDHLRRSKVRLPGQDRERIHDFFFTVGVALGG